MGVTERFAVDGEGFLEQRLRLHSEARDLPADNNASALIYELAHAGLIDAWVSPAILEEDADVLGDHPEFVAEIVESFPVCYPLTELNVIRQNRTTVSWSARLRRTQISSSR
jgi:hypothetical protein